MLLLNVIVGLGELEHKLEELVPLFVWDQKHSKRSNHICDVLLYKGGWLSNKSLQEEGLCLLLISNWKVAPELSNNLAEVDARELTNVLVSASSHED